MSKSKEKATLNNSNSNSSDFQGLEKQESKKKMLEEEAMKFIFKDMKDADGGGKTRSQLIQENQTYKVKSIIRIRKLIKYNDTTAAFLAISGMMVALFEYYIYHQGAGEVEQPSKDVYAMIKQTSDTYGLTPDAATYADFTMAKYNVESPLTISLRFLVSISTAVLMVPLFFHMILNHKLSILTGKAKVGVSILRTRHFRSFIFEVFINLIHCPPYLDAVFTFTQIDFTVTYSLDLILSNLMLLRIYLGLRLFSHYSKWRSELAMKYCEMEGCEANTVFALKASLKESPYLSLLIAFLVSSILLGVPVMNFEEPLNEYLSLLSGGASAQNYTLWNSIWLIVITMTTVGFGDFFARSHIGRFASVLSIFWGIFLTSMMVVTLTNAMMLDAKESRAFNILYRLKARKNLEDKATFMVTQIIRARALANDFLRRKEGLDDKKPGDKKKLEELEENYNDEKAEIYSKLDIFKSRFHEADSDLKSADDDPVEEIRKLNYSIEHDFNEMRKFFLAIKEIEANLQSIQKSHEIIDKIIQQCNAYNELFDKEIMQYKGGIFEIDKKKKANQA